MPLQEYTILALSLLVGSMAHFERVSWEISTKNPRQLPLHLPIQLYGMDRPW